MSMIGKWTSMYADLPAGAEPEPFGDSISYERGALWLRDCATIEDWGCGLGWFRTMIGPDQGYAGLDGTDSPFADLVVDLTKYRSQVPGLFMRHVLEHNHDWAKVLDNAVASFTERMVLVLFTPMAITRTHVIPRLQGHGGINVPAYSFWHEDLIDHFGDALYLCEDVKDPRTMFGQERIYYLSKEKW